MDFTLSQLALAPFSISSLAKRLQLLHDLLAVKDCLSKKDNVSTSTAMDKEVDIHCNNLISKLSTTSQFTLGYYLTEDSLNSNYAQPAWTRSNSFDPITPQENQHGKEIQPSKEIQQEKDENLQENQPNNSALTLNQKFTKLKITAPQTFLTVTDSAKQGWLWVKCHSSNQWNKYWCILQNEKVWFCSSPDSLLILGSVPLSQGYEFVPVLKPVRLKSKFAFEVRNVNARSFTFCCLDQLDCMHWAKRVICVCKRS